MIVLLTMTKNKAVWDVIWQVVKFILTLGLSHIAKREKNRDSEMSNKGDA